MIARVILAAALSILAMTGSAFAANEIFTVRNVAVDATAEGSAQARDIALAEGQRAAYQLLMQRLTRQRDWAEIPQVTTDGLANLILGFQVSNERSSATHYVARVTFSFRPEKVRELLRTSGLGYSESRSRPAVLLPVYNSGGQVILWGEGNAWRDAWAKRDLANDLVPILLPQNDAQDAALIPPGTAQSGDWSQLAPIAQKYGVDRVIVAVASETASGLTVRVRQISSFQNRSSDFTVGASDPPTQLDQGVDGALLRVDEEWKSATIVSYGQQNTLLASIRYGSLQEWLSIRRRLGQVPSITSVEVLAMSVQGAEVRVNYAGSADQLSASLAQLSLSLATEGSAYTIRSGVSAPSAGLTPPPAQFQGADRPLIPSSGAQPAQ